MKRLFKTVLILTLTIFLIACGQLQMEVTPVMPTVVQSNSPDTIINIDYLVVHYIDVGQADSIFIELPNKQTMLIDAGNTKNGQEIKGYIEDLDYTRIDYLVATHPHADHIGGMSLLVEAFDIGQIYMPRVAHSTQTYENLLLAIKNRGLKITAASAGMQLIAGDMLTVSILAPVGDEYDDLNNYSVVLKIEYGGTSFLFMGDAEYISENEINEDVSADVIKIGHHGSASSTSDFFLDRVNPSIAIVSVGAYNNYGHPDDEVIKRMDDRRIIVLRTDINGTVITKSDGKEIECIITKND